MGRPNGDFLRPATPTLLPQRDKSSLTRSHSHRDSHLRSTINTITSPIYFARADTQHPINRSVTREEVYAASAPRERKEIATTDRGAFSRHPRRSQNFTSLTACAVAGGNARISHIIISITYNYIADLHLGTIFPIFPVTIFCNNFSLKNKFKIKRLKMPDNSTLMILLVHFIESLSQN